MIKIENTEVYGWEATIRGMRNPLNSWDKSDTSADEGDLCGDNCMNCIAIGVCDIIGDNDLELMKKLVSSGPDHSKFMRMITVACDITAPLYFWKEFDTYKVGTVRNSCSTMHKIAGKEFNIDDFSHEHLIITEIQTGNSKIVKNPMIFTLDSVICQLNYCREKYLETSDKIWWWQMIQLLPSSYNQRATVQLNYAVLRNMYHARKNHKLDCWRDFCKWIKTLPYSELITMKGGEKS